MSTIIIKTTKKKQKFLGFVICSWLVCIQIYRHISGCHRCKQSEQMFIEHTHIYIRINIVTKNTRIGSQQSFWMLFFTFAHRPLIQPCFGFPLSPRHYIFSYFCIHIHSLSAQFGIVNEYERIKYGIVQ